MDEHSDFFILDTTAYKKCHYHTHQADMNVLATKDDVVRKSMINWSLNIYLYNMPFTY